jgi:hypothetical protein
MALPRIDTYKLFNAQTANATSASVIAAIPSGFTVYASGGFGGGNVQMQVSPDGGTTWVNDGTTITADGVTEFSTAATAVRAVLAGATAATLSLWVVPHDNR